VAGVADAGPRAKSGKGKAGGGGLQLDASLLDGDFDPEEWDRRMAAAFNDDYYVSSLFSACFLP
jgi:hypothetical protein